MSQQTKLPWVNFPSAKQNNQQEGNHRTVNIRCGHGSVSIRCASREQADRLGMALIGLFKEACTPKSNPNQPDQ